MFDAKSILDSLVTGGRRASSNTSGPQGDPLSDLLGSGGGSLGDMLRNAIPSSGSSGGQQGDPLSDLLGRLGGGASGSAETSAGAQTGSAGGLGDLLGQLAGGAQAAGDKAAEGGRNITDVLGDIFSQATQGTKEGAQHLDQATGASDRLGDLTRQFSGKSPDEILASLRELVENNKLGTGAALGGLGALVLGTQTGRSAALTAAKLGAVALIGGLAYKAYRNYQDGQSTEAAASGDIEAAPQGSGFEADAVSNDDAMLMIRTMIAAAAADGRIDATEQEKIMANLGQGAEDLDAGAQEFLAAELNKPATAAEIAAQVSSESQAAQVYAAARLAIDPDTDSERRFLQDLADRLTMDNALAGHIDAAARSA